MTFDNLAKAIGAFERKLVTFSRWDKFLGGDQTALSDAEKAGLNKFLDVGCQTCHDGVYVGGSMFQKLGLAKPWDNANDPGRFAVTKQEADRMVFKVPTLRNIEKTAPYYHDGSIATLEEAVRRMAEHQLAQTLSKEEVDSIVDLPEGAHRRTPHRVHQRAGAAQEHRPDAQAGQGVRGVNPKRRTGPSGTPKDHPGNARKSR